jgi:hypothetical protein
VIHLSLATPAMLAILAAGSANAQQRGSVTMANRPAIPGAAAFQDSPRIGNNNVFTGVAGQLSLHGSFIAQQHREPQRFLAR